MDQKASTRILLLTYISPFERFGSAQRTRLLIDALGRHGVVDVLVLRLGTDRANGGRFTETLLGGVRVMELSVARAGLASLPRFDVPSGHVSRQVARHVALESYDLLVSRYIKPALKVVAPPHVPVIVDFDDALYVPPWRVFTGPKMWGGGLLRLFNDRVLVRGTLRLFPRRHSHYFFCRQAERQAFGWLPGSVLPNLAAVPQRPGPPTFVTPDRPALMFIGLLDYLPNRDAVNWFLEEIWPLVRRRVPLARFLVVGSGSAQVSARWSSHPGVEVLGFVESLADTYEQVTACVVPMRAGAGTNIKALEAYQYGRMVIATHDVLAGHGALFRQGEDMLTANDPVGFARHCIDMLTDPGRAATIAKSGYARVSTVLTRERFGMIVDDAVRAAMPR